MFTNHFTVFYGYSDFTIKFVILSKILYIIYVFPRKFKGFFFCQKKGAKKDLTPHPFRMQS